jgi:tRNA-2-methylthio-N6-dimethylallyladenosine synthase
MKATVYIETLGCQMNVADTERASTRLREAGFVLTDSAQASDVIIFNTCSVRARAVQKVFTRIGEVRNSKSGHRPIIGVMGCVAQLEGESLFDHSFKLDLVMGTQATDRLPLLVERALQGRRRSIDLGNRDEGDYWNVSASVRHSPFVAFVPIIEGCNKFCSYCIVPFSRGREISRTATEIIDEVCRLREEGFYEIHLIGQNVNSYRPRIDKGLEGFPGATPFSRLLRAVAATGMARIKFTTSFPRDFHPDIVKAIDENENLCDWVHLPVQSGSNRILRSMRRGYKVEDYLRRVDVIKSARRRLALTSDIIIGFPGETSEEFEETLSLAERCQYDSLYIFKYSERAGTFAARLKDDISSQEKAARFLALESLQRNIQNRINKSYIGRELRVLVEGESAKSQFDMTGHSTCHKVINFPGDISLRGREVAVCVTAAKANSLYGAQSKMPSLS